MPFGLWVVALDLRARELRVWTGLGLGSGQSEEGGLGEAMCQSDDSRGSELQEAQTPASVGLQESAGPGGRHGAGIPSSSALRQAFGPCELLDILPTNSCHFIGQRPPGSRDAPLTMNSRSPPRPLGASKPPPPRAHLLRRPVLLTAVFPTAVLPTTRLNVSVLSSVLHAPSKGSGVP